MPENEATSMDMAPSVEVNAPPLRETLELAGRRKLEELRLEKSRELFNALSDYTGAEETRVASSGSERVIARQIVLAQSDGTVITLRIVESNPVNVNNPRVRVATYIGTELQVEENAAFPESPAPSVFINTHLRSISSDSDYSLRDLQRAIGETLAMDDLLQLVEAGKLSSEVPSE